ncbi:SepM family pheromone-processing serine protease [Laceyella putida]|jgi:PDZ domain-containing protein|uniref:endopeptidase La n=1 Tax=Laceyella putida TaxID=110101 RepID=A0ABW2RMX3_9BACL
MSLNRSNQKIVGVIVLSIICLIMGGAFVIPIPYFAIGPGKAVEVQPLVTVGKETDVGEGSFMLTTISMKQGSPFDFLLARWTGTIELVPEEQILAQDEDKQDYQRRQKVNMMESQNQAIVAAYHYAKRPVTQKVLGIEVERVLKEGTPLLQEGDLIMQMDSQPAASTKKLIAYLSRKRPGERIALTVLRDGQKRKLRVPLVALPVDKGERPRAGLGIVPVEKVNVKTTPPARIDAGEIGGPSAGLMFTLEVLNRLVPEDLTRGYRIAGTGTITADGEVGQIGGIQHKVVAADEAGAELFFCPKDINPEDQNEKTAKDTVKRLGINMRVIPVANLNEAVQALKKLPLRERASFKSKTLTGVA